MSFVPKDVDNII